MREEGNFGGRTFGEKQNSCDNSEAMIFWGVRVSRQRFDEGVAAGGCACDGWGQLVGEAKKSNYLPDKMQPQNLCTTQNRHFCRQKPVGMSASRKTDAYVYL
jgi:hypothetical protein